MKKWLKLIILEVATQMASRHKELVSLLIIFAVIYLSLVLSQRLVCPLSCLRGSVQMSCSRKRHVSAAIFK